MDARLVQSSLHIENSLLGRLQHGVQPAQNCHRQDDVPVFSTYVEVAEYVVCYAPDVVGDPAEL